MNPQDDNDSTNQDGGHWPPDFPHLAIDELVERLGDSDSLPAEEVTALLAMVAKEAQRLRSTVVRLSTAKLSEADREARTILNDAHEHAHTMRTLGINALDRRLDEADQLFRAMRAAFHAELNAHAAVPQRPAASVSWLGVDPIDEDEQ